MFWWEILLLPFAVIYNFILEPFGDYLKYFYRYFTHPYWYVPNRYWYHFPGMTIFKANQIMDICQRAQCIESGLVRGFLDMNMIGIVHKNGRKTTISICECCYSVGDLDDEK